MAENKTKPTNVDPKTYIESVDHPVRRRDSETLLALMTEITGEKPVMWGDSMIGFGRYHYTYDSGREGDFFKTGFSPRKANSVIYIMPGYDDYSKELSRLGPHRKGRSCLYITNLEKVDMDVLQEIITKGWTLMTERYGA